MDNKRGGRRRRQSKAFAPTSSKPAPRKWTWFAIPLWLFPAYLFVVHLAFGANHVVAAQWLTLVTAAALVVALAVPAVRIRLFDLRPVWPVALLFIAVLGAVGWSLTPWAPGGPHPIWAWAQLPAASTVNRSATVLELVKLSGLACAFVLGWLQGARRDWARSTIQALLILGAVYAAISLLVFLSGQQVMRGGRLSGGFLSANSGATVFGMLTVLGVANLLREWRNGANGRQLIQQLGDVATPLACVLLFVACLLLTASRMGVAATAVATSLLLIWDMVGSGNRRRPLMIVAILVVAGVVLLVGGNDLLWARFDAVDRDTMVRSTIFEAHWRAFLDSPLFGYGLGTFNDINSQIMSQDNYPQLWSIRATHNLYLQWLEEVGLIGAIPMFLLVATILSAAIWRVGQVRRGKTILKGLIATGLVVLFHGTTDFALQTPSIAVFWAFLLGLQFSFGQDRQA